MSPARCLVTGVNGHLLANVLVRDLVARGDRVRALVIDTGTPHECERLPGCEVVYTDVEYRRDLDRALDGVEVLYHATYAMEYKAKDIEAEIVRPALERTRQTLEAAARHGVRKVVLTSCWVTIDHLRTWPWSAGTWNPTPFTPYERTRTLAERLSWEIAEARGLDMTSLLPSRMVGPFEFSRSTTFSMRLLRDALLRRGWPPLLDTGFPVNWVDVREVARAALAAERARGGARYLLANPEFLSQRDLFEVARELSPAAQRPWRPARGVLKAFAALSEAAGAVRRRPPLLDRWTVDRLYGAGPGADIAASTADLGFAPRDPRETVREVYRYLLDRAAGQAA